MTDKLKEALAHISDGHIAEAAQPRKRRIHFYLGAIAAILAIVLLINGTGIPLAIQAEAVSLARYPEYQWKHRGDEMNIVRNQLAPFFCESIRQVLLKPDSENRTFSPLNLYMALAISAELSGGNSREQILTLTGTDSIESLRDQANQTWYATYYDDGDQALLANSLWLDNQLTYVQSTMDTLADNYYTSVYRGDLGSKKINKAIRAWLNNQTGGLLKKEIESAGLEPNSVAIPVFALYSTVYYQAQWTDQWKFNPLNNEKGIFHTPNGDITTTYMTQKEQQTTYYWGEDFGAIALHTNDSSSMWLILPDEDKTVEDVLTSGEYLQTLLFPPVYDPEYENTNHKFLKVNLSLPKFDIRASGDLTEDVQALGITDIFNAGTADFSPSVTGEFPVWVSAVNQATRVAIDEEGVTAASYIEMPSAGAAMPPEEIIDFILDRPFIFIVTNRYSLPLFAGVVNEP